MQLVANEVYQRENLLQSRHDIHINRCHVALGWARLELIAFD